MAACKIFPPCVHWHLTLACPGAGPTCLPYCARCLWSPGAPRRASLGNSQCQCLLLGCSDFSIGIHSPAWEMQPWLCLFSGRREKRAWETAFVSAHCLPRLCALCPLVRGLALYVTREAMVFFVGRRKQKILTASSIDFNSFWVYF